MLTKRMLMIASSAALALAVTGASLSASAETLDTRIGKLEFTHDFANGYPTDETVTKLFDEMDFQRAVQAYIWSIPLISFEYWQGKQNKELGLKNGQLAYLVTYDEKVCCLTLNVTTPYVQTFIDLREDGPMVIEIPQGGEVRGATHDMWQIEITQMTRPGKYLFVGPYQEVPPEAESEGYIINHSPMNDMFVGIRLIPEDENKREELLKNTKIYPYKDRKNPKVLPAVRPTKPWFAHAPRDMEYWQTLSDSINTQPVREVDRYIMGMLRKLGIEKGEPFDPDERQTKILKEALVVGEAMAKANDFSKRLEKGFTARVRTGSSRRPRTLISALSSISSSMARRRGSMRLSPMTKPCTVRRLAGAKSTWVDTRIRTVIGSTARTTTCSTFRPRCRPSSSGR